MIATKVPRHEVFICQTQITLISRIAELGLVDPTISTKKGVDVSVEDMSGYINFLKNKFNIKAENQKIKAFEKLADEASPLTLGRAYREYIKAREDTKKLLSFSYKDKAIDIRLQRSAFLPETGTNLTLSFLILFVIMFLVLAFLLFANLHGQEAFEAGYIKCLCFFNFL